MNIQWPTFWLRCSSTSNNFAVQYTAQQQQELKTLMVPTELSLATNNRPYIHTYTLLYWKSILGVELFNFNYINQMNFRQESFCGPQWGDTCKWSKIYALISFLEFFCSTYINIYLRNSHIPIEAHIHIDSLVVAHRSISDYPTKPTICQMSCEITTGP